MSPTNPDLDLLTFESTLMEVGLTGATDNECENIQLLVALNLAELGGNDSRLVATNRLFELAPVRTVRQLSRRVLSLDSGYRKHLVQTLVSAVRTYSDDESLADTLERIDHLSAELLACVRDGESGPVSEHSWDVSIWQSPDAITLLSKVVEQPFDVASLSARPVVPVGFNWLEWDTPPENAAPAPWADTSVLKSPLKSVRHPFWGALTATLDACTGDYEWQSLVLRGGRIRSQHRTVGKAEPIIELLWREELGLYPVPPLVVPDDIPFVPGKPLHWLQRSLDHLAEAGIATELDGSWRLTDHFRTELMKDDEHMIAFEAVRQRSYRLATSAGRITDIPSEVVAQ